MLIASPENSAGIQKWKDYLQVLEKENKKWRIKRDKQLIQAIKRAKRMIKNLEESEHLSTI
jgi:hypothetical protein